jgi:hypothetical protein
MPRPCILEHGTEITVHSLLREDIAQDLASFMGLSSYSGEPRVNSAVMHLNCLVLGIVCKSRI